MVFHLHFIARAIVCVLCQGKGWLMDSQQHAVSAIKKKWSDLQREWNSKMKSGTTLLSQVSNLHLKLGYVDKDSDFWEVLDVSPVLQERVIDKLTETLQKKHEQLEGILQAMVSIIGVSSFMLYIGKYRIFDARRRCSV